MDHMPCASQLLEQAINQAKLKGAGYLAIHVTSLPGRYRVSVGEIKDKHAPVGDIIKGYVPCAAMQEYVPLPSDTTLEQIAEKELAALNGQSEMFFLIVQNRMYRPAVQPTKAG